MRSTDGRWRRWCLPAMARVLATCTTPTTPSRILNTSGCCLLKVIGLVIPRERFVDVAYLLRNWILCPR
ncbi:hypothetical protein PR003_g13167 [Phytophthora rubi]|uniref:Secreted protein n=1 Tax=Phytophthora rubi TaxID=129364 RepID=A0A6A3MAE5_9STRA|nr:hypothetical protein PR002_g12471 [Phytophthora rubi]KAE9027208.1 hypothetical protein PR001_g12022 [Phytophthora rubi]KAE9335143.1 hypothetical protein PR003_g13167 [Phytophthora rubi]